MKASKAKKNKEKLAAHVLAEAALFTAGEKSDDAYDIFRTSLAAFAIADAHFAEARSNYLIFWKKELLK